VRDDDATKISIPFRPGGCMLHGVVRDIGAGTIAGAVVGVMELLEGESPPILQEMKTATMARSRSASRQADMCRLQRPAGMQRTHES
jgi:hypothetical protein